MTEEEIDYGDADDTPDDIDNDIEPADLSEFVILSYLTADPVLWNKTSIILKPEYFQPEYKPVVEFVTSYLRKYKKLPSRNIIRAETSILLDTPDDATDERVHHYICDKTEDFCRYSAMKSFLIKSSDIISKDVSMNTIFNLTNQAKKICQISLHRDMGFEVHTSTKEKLENAVDKVAVPTGFRHMDLLLDGGVTRPSFNMLSANSGKGKSVWLMNLAIKAAERGENVLFYSMELSLELCQRRFAAMLAGTPINAVMGNLSEVDFHLKKRKRDNNEGIIWIQKFPQTGTTIGDIENHYIETQSMLDVRFGTVMLDYFDVMTSMEKVSLENIHMKDKLLSHETNDFIHSNDLILWTASQRIKGSDGEDELRVGSISGGNDKVNAVDNIIIIHSTEKEQEQGINWGLFRKARSSAADGKRFPLKRDMDSQLLTDADDELFLTKYPYMADKLGLVDRMDQRDVAVKNMKLPMKEKKSNDVMKRLNRTFGDRV